MVMLSRWPFYRDTTFCFVSMFVMVITMYDSVIMWSVMKLHNNHFTL